ncbi:sugar transporter [Sphingobium sp. AR-3-1]|uniref:Sugar transporter n=1 Tax=Sphingobium psychrophilum TaxID=2728834 RepID=A0A7X9WSU9_9SPHN|nr:sugar transporter [Sphingobium psychrophilum]NML09183.1 sugar transporter [Sphingobium psychrophilum]
MATSRSVTIIGVILLLWGLIGIAAFTLQYSMDLDALARTDPAGARAFALMPAWVWIVYAIAVATGTLGAIALLLRKAIAAFLFLISLVCVIVQFGFTFLGTDLLADKGWAVAIPFPAFVIAVAVFEWLYARSLVAKGVLR